MIDWNRWLPGLGDEQPEDDDPVTKTLRALGQVPDRSAAGISTLSTSLGDIGRSAGQSVVGAVQGAATAVSDAYAVPTEQRPPQYSGPSYSQPSLAPGEQSTAERLPGIAQAGIEGASDMLGDRGAMLAGLKPPQTAMEVIEQAAPAPVRGLQIGREALRAAGGAALEAAPQTTEPLFTTNEIQTPLGTIPSMTGPTPQQAGRFVGEELADPTNYLSFGAAGRAADAPVGAALSAAGRGLRDAPGVVRRGASAAVDAVSGALDDNAGRMAAADARMAEQGSTTAPGVFGLSGIEPGRPEVQGMRPRIIPPDVADQLDIPLRLPEDPSVIRAIEAAGGTVDPERGVTLNVIRHQDPEAAGGAATRSMTFYTAGPPGAPSEYARTGTVGPQGVGGQQRIEGPTRFRNPLFISDAPGEARGFDDAMQQMVPEGAGSGQFVVRNRRSGNTSQAFASSDEAQRYLDGMPETIRTDLQVRERPNAPPPTASEVEAGIRAAKRAGPAGSAARAEALKTLVTRYGGDADVIDDLIELRGAEMGESVYAVKENIVAGNARRAGHDGVITLKQGIPDYAAINEHPAVVAANQALQDANAAEREAHQWVDLWESRLRLHGQGSRDAADEGWARLQRLAENEGRRTPVEAQWVVQNKAGQAEQRARDAVAEVRAAWQQARAELTPREITELADPRELRNPTPGTPTAALKAAYKRAKDAEARFSDLYRGPPADEEVFAAARREVEEANAALEALMNQTDTAPGYTLRPDIPARAGTPEAARRAEQAAEEAAHQARLDAAFNHPDVQAAGQRVGAAEEALKQARASGDSAAMAAAYAERDAAYAEHARLQREAFQAGGVANASAGAAPRVPGTGVLPAVNRALSEGIAGGVGGAVIEQGRNPDEDPRTAAARGFAAGAVGFPLATRAARGAARLAGRGVDMGGGARIGLGDVPPSKLREPTLPGMEAPYVRQTIPDVSDVPNRPPVLGDVPPSAIRQPGLPGMGPAPPRPIGEELADLPMPGMMPSLPSVQKSLTAAEERAASMQARGLTPPSAWDWIKQAGYSGIFGPATLVGNVTAGVVDTGLAQVKEATRALTMRQGGRYGAQAKAQLQAVPEALEGLKAIAFGQGGSAGAAARSGGSQGTANLSERVVNPVAHVAARLMEKPGEILAEAPDAVFRPIFNAQGMQREADRIAHELGHRGQQAAQTTEQLMQDARSARANPNQPLVSAEARRIVDAGKAYADEMGYKGDPGGLATWIGDLSKRDDAAGVAASFLFPFSRTPGNIAIAAARSTPGIGLLPGVRRGRPVKSFDVIYDQAFGTLAASGLAAYAASGGITGSGPASKPERDAMVAQGWQPRSTLVAGHYIPNRAFGKLQPMLDAIGESHDALAYRKPDQSASAFATDAVKRLGKIATDQVGLSGLADVFDLIDGFGAQAPGLVGRSITRYTPFGGVIRAAAQAIDPNARKPETWDQAGFSEATRQQVEQSIPGLRGDVPAAQDVLGRDAPNPQQGWGALIPKTTTVRDDPTIRAYQESGVPLSGPPDTVDGVALTPAQQRRYQAVRGQEIQRLTGPLIARAEWATMAPETRKMLLTTMLDTARTLAEVAVAQEGGQAFSEGRTKAILDKAQGR